MKTIHITEELKIDAQNTLLKELFKKILKNDNEFHFFHEPELVIRVEDKTVDFISEFLVDKRLEFKTYDYPIGKGKKGNFCYECDQYVLDNIELFKQIYHASSVLFFKLSKEDQWNYLSRIQHTASNTFGKNYLDEAAMYTKMGEFYYRQTIRTLMSDSKKGKK